MIAQGATNPKETNTSTAPRRPNENGTPRRCKCIKYGYMVTNTMYSTQFYGLERIVKCEKLPLSGSGRA